MNDIDALISDLKNPDKSIRREAVEELGQLGPAKAKKSIPALVMVLLNDKDKAIVSSAKRVLVHFGVPAWSDLKEAYYKYPDRKKIIAEVAHKIKGKPGVRLDRLTCGCGHQMLVAPKDKKCPKCGHSYKNNCWRCGRPVASLANKRCEMCGWYICSRCGACGCRQGG